MMDNEIEEISDSEREFGVIWNGYRAQITGYRVQNDPRVKTFFVLKTKSPGQENWRGETRDGQRKEHEILYLFYLNDRNQNQLLYGCFKK